MKTLLVLMVLIVLTTGCRSNSDPVVDTDDGVLIQDLLIDVESVSREYHLFVPKEPNTARMVFLLHGNSGSSDQILGLKGTVAPYKRWIDIARRENLILVIPNGSVGTNERQGWNDCRVDGKGNPTSDDVQLISNLIEELSKKYDTNQTQAFIVGTSNGGLMSMRLAQEIPENLLGVASIVASMPVNSKCLNSTVPVSVLIMNGTEDPILPYLGGLIGSDRGEVLSTQEVVNYWINRNQTSVSASQVEFQDINTKDDSSVRVITYSAGVNSTKVVHYEVVGGGHTEPSIAERYGALFKLVVGEQNGDIEMAEETWRFFESLSAN